MPLFYTFHPVSPSDDGTNILQSDNLWEGMGQQSTAMLQSLHGERSRRSHQVQNDSTWDGGTEVITFGNANEPNFTDLLYLEVKNQMV